MRTYLIILFLFLCNCVQSQIALNDCNCSHSNTVLSYIQMNSVNQIYINGYSGISFNTDSTLISANAFIAGSFLKLFIYEQTDRIHVFAGMNNISQVNEISSNYDKNVLTVTAASYNNVINPTIHPKFDFAVNSCDVGGSCATSWASGYAVGLIDKHFISHNQNTVTGASIKASVLNSLNGFILDTNKLKRQEFISDSLGVNQYVNHSVALNQLCDSVQVTLFYFDRPDNQNLLLDTLIVNNNKVNSNKIKYTLYNTSAINITINSALCDSFYIQYEYNNVFDTINDTLSFVRLSDTTGFVFCDSIIGYYNNDSGFVAFGKRWQYGDTVNIRRYFNIDLFDTVHLYRKRYNYVRTDTIEHSWNNKIHYAIAYLPYFQQNVLPVELISFEVIAKESNMLLTWQTETETNNSHFKIERSANGIDFETIGVVSGNGTVAEVSDYHFVDRNPVDGINYYRLKQVDYNGDFEYSDIRSIEISKQDAIRLQGNYLQTNSNSFIYNAQGQLVTSFNHQFDISQLSSGIYFIRSIENENYSTFKFIKP